MRLRSLILVHPALARSLAGGLMALTALGAACFAPLAHAGMVAWPREPQARLDTLHDRPLTDAQRQLRQARRALTEHPTHLPHALQVAGQALSLAREEGDTRYLAQAQAALAPWWQQADAPPEVRLMRATVRQALHDFDAAHQELHALTQQHPEHTQAWWTLATVRQLTGRYAEARQACEGMQRNGATWQATLCLADLDSFQGRAQEARQSLSRLMWRAPKALLPHLVLVRAELAERLGEQQEAAQLYDTLAGIARDPYSEGALADWLLDQGQAQAVWDRLKDRTRHDGLLLRLAEAATRLQRPEAPALARQMGERLAAARHRGDSIHWREEARFELRVRKRPQEALRLALVNWGIQKEPIDARLVLDAARAAGRPQAAQAVIDFCRQAGWTDVRLGVRT